MSRAQDAHATRLKMELVGLVQTSHGMPAEDVVELSPLQLVRRVDYHVAETGPVEQAAYGGLLIIVRHANGDPLGLKVDPVRIALADQLGRSQEEPSDDTDQQ